MMFILFTGGQGGDKEESRGRQARARPGQRREGRQAEGGPGGDQGGGDRRGGEGLDLLLSCCTNTK